MATIDLVASTVMDGTASLMNDTAKSVYSYAAQLPYLRIAMQELQEYFEMNNIAVTQEVSAVIPVNAGVTAITFDAAGTPANPALPNDMVEPAQLWEQAHNTPPFVPMTKRDYLPHYLEQIQSNQFFYYVWEDQQIKFLPAVQFNDIKIDYVRQIFNNIPNMDQNTQINVINATTFLEFKTAALMAEYIERNLDSAKGFEARAIQALDRVTSIGVKGKQNIMTRRRPFRAGYKKRGWMT